MNAVARGPECKRAWQIQPQRREKERHPPSSTPHSLTPPPPPAQRSRKRTRLPGRHGRCQWGRSISGRERAEAKAQTEDWHGSSWVLQCEHTEQRMWEREREMAGGAARAQGIPDQKSWWWAIRKPLIRDVTEDLGLKQKSCVNSVKKEWRGTWWREVGERKEATVISSGEK